MPTWLRARLPFVLLALSTIALGLTLRRSGAALPLDVRDVLGDALWAMMLTWWVGAAAPRISPVARAAAALAGCWAVEASQLYRAPTLDGWRRTTLGHLVLGSDFDARDLVSYAVGVLIALLLELAVRHRAEGGRAGSGPASSVS
jgi:hypothetical protein